jgi:hypothetical protein
VPAGVAEQVGHLPPVASLFAAFLALNPIGHLVGPATLSSLPAANQQALTGREFFPRLIQGPFHNGLIVVFTAAAILAVLGALASLLRGPRPTPVPEQPDRAEPVLAAEQR